MTEQETQQGQQEQQTQTQETQPTNKDKFFAGFKEKHPDLDEEGIYGYAIESYKDKKNKLNDYDNSSARLLDLLNNDDDAISFFEAAAETGDIRDALRGLPEDVLEDVLEKKRSGYRLSDEDKEKKVKEYGDRVAKQRAFRQKIKDNQGKTAQALEDFAKENGLTDKDMEKMVLPILEKLSEGEIDKDLLSMINNNRTLEEIKQKEYQRGLADGRNGKIEEKELKKGKGSGLPKPMGTQQTPEEESAEDRNNPFAFMTKKNL